MFDFSQLPVIDAHMHPFSPNREHVPYARAWSQTTFNECNENMPYLYSYRMVLQELKRLFNLPKDASDDEVMKIRHNLARKDYKAFTKQLFQEARIVAIISDYGFPVTVLKGSSTLSSDEISEFNHMMEDEICDVYDVIRIETTTDRVFQPGMTYEDFMAAFDKDIDDRSKARKVVGMKSVIGYYCGLDIKPVSNTDAKEAFYGHFYIDHDNKKANKKLRDHMFFHGMELCTKYDFPLKIHTGAGSAPMSDLRTMNPNCLYDVINTEQGLKTKLVLTHGGVSYIVEAAYLAQCYPNVHLDMSQCGYTGAFIERSLPDALDWCTNNKITFGSDAGGMLDQTWFATVLFKRILAEELEKRVNRNQITRSYAESIAKGILYENAKKLYKL